MFDFVVDLSSVVGGSLQLNYDYIYTNVRHSGTITIILLYSDVLVNSLSSHVTYLWSLVHLVRVMYWKAQLNCPDNHDVDCEEI